MVDTTTAEWVGFPIPELGVDPELIPLIADPDTGMQVFKTVYRAGFTNEWHTHPLRARVLRARGHPPHAPG